MNIIMSPEVLTYLQRNNKNQITVTFSEGNITKWPNRRPAIIYGKPKTTYDYQLFEKENIEVFVGKDIAAAYSTLTLDFFNIFFSKKFLHPYTKYTTITTMKEILWI